MRKKITKFQANIIKKRQIRNYMLEISRQTVLEGEIHIPKKKKNVGNLTNRKVWTQIINMWKIIGER